jgi:peptide/nickel transport system substrate-binding protein
LRIAARLALAVVVTAALGLAGCVGGEDREASARDGGSIVVGLTPVPATLDPALASQPSELQLLWLVHTPLLTYARKSGREATEVVPGLANAMPQVFDNGTTYRLSLRRGLRYSNGVPVRAGDFERAIDRLRRLDSPLAPLYSGIVSIDTDARSGVIEVRLARPDRSFVHLLALPSSAPLPRGTPVKDLSSRPPPGVGPYRVFRPGPRAVLDRMPGFELPGVPAGHVDRISLARPAPPARQVRAVIAGSLDVMQDPAPVDLLPEVRSKYADRYREDAAAVSVALVPDTDEPPLDDAVVRRAVGESLDAQTLTRLYSGLFEPGCNLLPEAIRGHRRLDPCPYGDREEPPDLPAAQQQVEEAGASGAGVSVRADPGVPPAVESYVIRTLRKIGLSATARRGGALIRVRRFAPLVGHPAAYLEPLSASVFDPDLAEAVSEGTVGPAGARADEAWAAADRRVVDEGYAVPLGTERRPAFLSERLDAENCANFQPLFGLDLSSLCLR